MATSLMVDAATGLVFDQLFRTVSNIVQKPMMYSSNLERMKATLTSITSIAKEIDGFNKVLDRRKEEVEQLMTIIKEGEELVLKCAKIKRWNLYKKSRYADKLRELEEALVSFCQMAMQFQQTRDQKETLLEVKDLRMDLRRLSSKESNGGFCSQAGFMGMCNPTKQTESTIGLDVPLEELKWQLFKDGEQVIVVSAPGGSGKTTLAKMLCYDEDVKGKFQENIFFVNVSKSASLKAIIQKIFQHKGSQVPEFQCEEDAVNALEKLLNKTGPYPILLVLDDVWSGSEYIIDKLKLHITDYKILVTSRFVFPRFGSTYKLEKLNDECAMTLFRHSACLTDGSSPIPDEDLVNKIVKSCKGSPLVLSVVGRSLCGQPEAIWQSRVMEWSEGGSIFDSNCELLDRLQSSLDVLDNKRKACYLDLGAFSEYQMIPATSLIDMWYELYNLPGVHVIANLYDLSFRNLIDLFVTRKDDGDDSCYKDYFVRQHDLLRELAICRSILEPIERRERVFLDIGGDNTPDWWIERKQKLIHARLLSISTDETFLSTWCDIQGPEVVALVLNFRSQNYKLPEFIQKMDKLKALIITNYGVSASEISDLFVLGSLSNIKRIRLELVSLPSLSPIQLHNLQKLSLVMCNVGQAFRCCTFQMSHAFPNLVEVNFEYCNDLVEFPAGLCDLVHLKKLSITNCHKLSALPNEIGKLVNLEVLRLSSCIDLLELPDTIGSLSKLRVLDISDCLGIEELPTQIGDLHNLRKLHMIGCSSCKLPSTISSLGNLDLVTCDEETSFLWEAFMFRLAKLRIKVHKEDVNLDWLHNLRF
ncbi:hypothetical protein HS088_TW14G00244 [Tripterygium wilfordii]|uniref:RPW8 domain-containing protein n=1 Tax=Tripterygium wilfordii TaxID=458696 RepID=A0A7J7CPV1_TRIWF|nr:probable disease resistance protein At5g66900 [Tripterygium wilfordii]KAF5736110.1 hypothetical protein HS088_TW14G00244 [Tripterygium wilfordii]